MVFLLFLLTSLVRSFQPTLGYFCPLNPWWHMLGSRVGLPFLSRLRSIKGGFGMPVIISRVRRKK